MTENLPVTWVNIKAYWWKWKKISLKVFPQNAFLIDAELSSHTTKCFINYIHQIILMFNWVTGRFSFMFTYINILWYLPELQVGFLSCSLTSISFDIYLGYRWVFFHVSYTSIAFDVYTSYRWIFFHLHLHQYPLMFTWVR
jgi:hypothetical protein